MNLKLQTQLRNLLYHFDYEHPIGLRENTEEQRKNVQRIEAENKQEEEENVCRKIDMLVKKGADPNEFNDFPLRLAVRAGLPVVVKHLISKYKADDTTYQYEALNDAIDGGHLNIARYLIKRLKSRLVQAEKKHPSPTF